ncbi:hypothetical protein NEHOM01_2364 [Nematocida homosporus]|uniref:uncharacterized protein n=1 Tax=Nematocida homosporus TaxID=1912981 RepID=UPI002220F41C|nr:uncharacterized protein NEHOM01_2364 [Nematocida homosporus]KAI5187783.1 hypothetical protein NEHOM01_2364 [Nematocida homosporus]
MKNIATFMHFKGCIGFVLGFGLVVATTLVPVGDYSASINTTFANPVGSLAGFPENTLRYLQEELNDATAPDSDDYIDDGEEIEEVDIELSLPIDNSYVSISGHPRLNETITDLSSLNIGTNEVEKLKEMYRYTNGKGTPRPLNRMVNKHLLLWTGLAHDKVRRQLALLDVLQTDDGLVQASSSTPDKPLSTSAQNLERRWWQQIQSITRLHASIDRFLRIDVSRFQTNPLVIDTAELDYVAGLLCLGRYLFLVDRCHTLHFSKLFYIQIFQPMNPIGSSSTSYSIPLRKVQGEDSAHAFFTKIASLTKQSMQTSGNDSAKTFKVIQKYLNSPDGTIRLSILESTLNQVTDYLKKVVHPNLNSLPTSNQEKHNAILQNIQQTISTLHAIKNPANIENLPLHYTNSISQALVLDSQAKNIQHNINQIHNDINTYIRDQLVPMYLDKLNRTYKKSKYSLAQKRRRYYKDVFQFAQQYMDAQARFQSTLVVLQPCMAPPIH